MPRFNLLTTVLNLDRIPNSPEDQLATADIPNHDLLSFSREAIVHETIFPKHRGWVWFLSSWWSARCPLNLTIYPGEVVYVSGIEGNTLLVCPIELGEIDAENNAENNVETG